MSPRIPVIKTVTTQHSIQCHHTYIHVL